MERELVIVGAGPAGMAAAVIGSVTTFVSLFLGVLVSQSYDGTMYPLVGGFAAMGLCALAVMGWTERARDDPSSSPVSG